MAKEDFFVNIDGNQNEVQNWSFQQLATDPVSPFLGQFWINTTDNKFKFYDGTSTIIVADSGDVLGLLDFKGGYNAATNTPDLDVTPSGVLKGDVYTVTAAGNFFTEAVEIGDMLFANIDSPTVLTDWTTVQNNVDQATETVRGVAELSTQAEVTTGTNDTNIITPLKLATHLATVLGSMADIVGINLDDGLGSVSRVFAGGVTTYTVTHGLTANDVVVQVKNIASGKNVSAEIDTVSSTVVEVAFNGDSTNNTFKATISG